MYARCDIVDLLVYENIDCPPKLECCNCYLHDNCDKILKLHKYVYNFKENKYVSSIIENYMIYTDGETP